MREDIREQNKKKVENKKSLSRRFGLVLFAVVVVCWIAVPVLPFFSFHHKAIVITALLVGGEILFVITIALLGKEYWNKIKSRFLQYFSSHKHEIEKQKSDTDEGTMK